jgi:uncharacterized protein YjbI with pentapeptide repeats
MRCAEHVDGFEAESYVLSMTQAAQQPRVWDEEAWASAAKRASHDGTIVARGAFVTRVHLRRLIALAPRRHGRPYLGRVDFCGATFGRGVSFDNVTFAGEADFSRARFRGTSSFAGAIFRAPAEFEDAVFESQADFSRARFAGKTSFARAQFNGHVEFNEGRFRRKVYFLGALFGLWGQFRNVQFHRDAYFLRAVFKYSAIFEGAFFGGQAWFSGVTFNGEARFNRALFVREARFAADAPESTAFLDEATFPGAHFLTAALFTGVTFTRRALFAEATFEGAAEFADASFKEVAIFTSAFFKRVTFVRATFEQEAHFGARSSWSGEGAVFASTPDFGGVQFHGRASFGSHESWRRAAVFNDGAEFGEQPERALQATSFRAEADFRAASVESDARFFGATFERGADFRAFSVGGRASFDDATFAGRTRFEGAAFEGGGPQKLLISSRRPKDEPEASFRGTSFRGLTRLGPMRVVGTAQFEDAAFERAPEIDLDALRLSLRRARFPQGAALHIRWAEISADEADFSGPTLLSSPDELSPLDDRGFRLCWIETQLETRPQSRILSLRGAHVANLVLSGVDVRACRFAGAHQLDKVRIEGTAQFELAPKGWTRTRPWPPSWRWAAREVIAEEQAWRRAGSAHINESKWRLLRAIRARNREGWYPRACALPARDATQEQPDPPHLAATYRALRKGREDIKNEPGAADFYYGEMEMRRRATDSRFERLILNAYWAVSGYGLRGGRALAWWLFFVLLFAAAFAAFGFDATLADADKKPPTGAENIVFSAEVATGLLRPPEVELLSTAGRLLQIVLRVTGPVLLGLALLAVRGRVRR